MTSIRFDATDLESLGEELTKGILEFNKEAKPVLLALGNEAADDMVNAILAGKDLTGSELKPNEASTVTRKEAKREHTKPLIDSGALSTRKNWKVGVRKSKKGIMHVVANPSKDRKLVFYSFLPKKGYNKSQGMTMKFAKKASEVTAKLIQKLMKRWMKGD